MERGNRVSPFWSRVRELMHEKAIELYMLDKALYSGCFNKPTEQELREGGYYERAKRLALRQMRLFERRYRTLRELEEDPEC